VALLAFGMPLAASAKSSAVYCDRVVPISKTESLCMIGEGRPTDADDGYALLVDKNGRLRLPSETYMQFDVKDPKTGEPWKFMLSETRYYSYAGRAYVKDFPEMKFYYYDKLGESVLAYTPVFNMAIHKVELKPVKDGRYTLQNGKTIEIKNQMLNAEWDEKTDDFLPFPFDAEEK
jgi:hypothetical protein